MSRSRRRQRDVDPQRMRIVVAGAVQGVGFRPFVYREATARGLAGFVTNTPQGVVIEVEGDVIADDVPAKGTSDVLGDASAGLCANAMQGVRAVAGSIVSESAFSGQSAPIGWTVSPDVEAALFDAEGAARKLDMLQQDHRAATLASVAPGNLTPVDAFARMEIVRRLDQISHHAWRSAAHLVGRAQV